MNYKRLLNSAARRFNTPQQLLGAAIEYFEWCERHPLQEEQVFHNKGMIVRTEVSKVRPFTKRALASYMGLTVAKLDAYRRKADAMGDDAPQWNEVMDLIEQTIFTQKFENAAAGLLNATIISRDLGLAEKQEVTGRDGEPLQQVVQYQLPSNGRD